MSPHADEAGRAPDALAEHVHLLPAVDVRDDPSSDSGDDSLADVVGSVADETVVGIGEPGQSLDEARFVPTPPASVLYALRSLLQYLRTESRDAPLIEIALVHYQFEAITRFTMGTARWDGC